MSPVSTSTNQGQWSDTAILLLIVIAAIGGATSIYFNSSNGLAYIQLGITIVGLFVSIKQVKHDFLGGFLRNIVSSGLLRYISIALLVVIVSLQSVILYQSATSAPHNDKSISGPISTQTPTSTSTSVPASITITTPTNGSKVPMLTSVEGTASGIPKDEGLLILIMPDGTTAHHPQSEHPIEVPIDGKWISSIRVGIDSDKGLGFTVSVALADQEGKAAIEKYFKEAKASGNFNGLDPLPKGIRLISQIRIIRT